LDVRSPSRSDLFHETKEVRVKILSCSARILTTAVVAVWLATGVALAQQASAPAAGNVAAASSTQIPKNVEAYLRHLYAFGPETEIHVGEPQETPVAGLLVCDVKVKISGSEENVKFYVSKNGQFLFRGELSDLTKDPLAETRASMKIKDAPAFGDSKAPITIVEYSDFECPVCRSLHDVMRGVLQQYPQARLVFMDFPLESIHPWARTAALAGRCAYIQNPKAFWTVYDLIYDHQDLIAAGNAYEKMTDYAGQSGLNADMFKSCMAGPEAAAAVDANIANGRELEVGSTPTIFVNGRRMVGADQRTLENYIKYELAQQKGGAK
jgi:protein-disulfide isomerase